MKFKIYSVVLIAILFIFPFAASAEIYFQNLSTSLLTVTYKYCNYTTPNPDCSTSTSVQIAANLPYTVPSTTKYNYVVIVQAYTDDGWSYKDPQTNEDCSWLWFKSVPVFASISKTLVKPWLQCQRTYGLAKLSK